MRPLKNFIAENIFDVDDKSLSKTDLTNVNIKFFDNNVQKKFEHSNFISLEDLKEHIRLFIDQISGFKKYLCQVAKVDTYSIYIDMYGKEDEDDFNVIHLVYSPSLKYGKWSWSSTTVTDEQESQMYKLMNSKEFKK